MKSTKRYAPLFVIGSLVCVSCSSPTAETKPSHPVAEGAPPASSPQSTNLVTQPARVDSVRPVEGPAVLTVGLFHADEVPAESASRTWMGLFQGQQGLYLQLTTIQVARVRDEIMDGEDGEETGWAVTTTHPDSSLLLMAGLPYLTERPLVPVLLKKPILLPGERADFFYQGGSYSLFATGRLEKGESEADGVSVRDYHLFFSASSGGQERRQLLVAHPTFDEEMIDILFVGDLDGDKVPDVILNKSNHYNVTNPALFLSKPTEKGALLQEVGEHVSVGC